DDEDPLGLLPGALRTSHGDVHDRVDEKRSSASSCLSMGPETTRNLGAAGDCYDACGDPREAIDAMLRSSRAVRDQVSWRQAQALSTYKAENQQLHKDLSLLPPTYSQYKAVRQRASSSRIRRSSPPTSAGLPGAPASVSHPLNFHLHGGAGSDNGMGGPNNEGEGPPTGLPAGGATGLEKESRVSEDKTSLDGGLVGEGGGVSGGEEVADEQAGGKRFSTLARAGSASENAMGRTLWPFRLKPSGEGDIPALRRGKVRGREMVFALLEAARVEEEDMVSEGTLAATEREPNMAFMRLDEARRRNAREVGRFFGAVSGSPSCVAALLHYLLRRKQAAFVLCSGPILSYSTRSRSTAARCSHGGVRRSSQQVAGGDSGTVVGDDKHGRGRSGTGDKAGCGITDSDDGGDCREVAGGGGRSGDGGHLEESAAQRDADDARGRVTGGEFLPFPSSDNAAPPVCHDGVPDGLRPGDPPQTARTRRRKQDEVEGKVRGRHEIPANERRDPAGDDGTVERRACDGCPDIHRVRARGEWLKPTLPDPNELNGSVMADPFNMDHMKDLPGLSGGDDIGLSKLVSAHVTFMDPAFPNLEFHRRAGMDRAGYFMPGYKPQVNSPGPAAGAYWLERRQSYRVKMAAP
ncbi:unnamed protein product, partial [Scytosiphon promiscuus]